MKDRAARPRQAGFTLIEVLITIAITGIVLASLVAAFSNQSRMFQEQTDLTKSQASARAALELMARDIRLAGYTGLPLGWQKILRLPGTAALTPIDFFPVVSLKDGLKNCNAAPYLVQMANNIAGIDGNSLPDAIAIMGDFTRQTTSLKTPAAQGTDTVVVKDLSIFMGTKFMAPAWILIGASGEAIVAEVYPIDSVAPGTTVGLNSGTVKILGNLANSYTVAGSTAGGMTPRPAVLSPIYLRVYYVRPNEEGLAGTRQPALYVRNYDKPYFPLNSDYYTDVLLAQGVSDLQLTYDTMNNVSRMELDLGMVCDPCTIRNVNITVSTWSDKFRANAPLVREFSTSVRVRNLGLGTVQNCQIVGCIP